MRILIALALAFLIGEYYSGSLHYCIYDLWGEEFILTIPATHLCPLTIEVPR